MKKSLLFVIDSLRAAGAEKSLVTFLSLLDYDRYEVDLQLFSYGGEFERYIPKEVKLLSPLRYVDYLVKHPLSNIAMVASRIKYSASIRFGEKSIKAKARKYWNCISSCIERNERQYDIAVAYGQCLPTFYIVDKVNASKKIGWINCIYHLDGYEKEFQYRFYDSLDNIVLVSNASFNHFQTVYPEFSEKMLIIPDMINPLTIMNMAQSGRTYKDDLSDVRLLTVARLDKRDKGYDISLEACRILRDRGLKFKWYAIGRGTYKEEMENYISRNHLKNTFVLLGTTPNPYPYIKNCTVYVQTSRHEGYGLSIAEARILNKPVVTTEFDAVYDQMVQGKNGLVVKQDPVAVADAIESLLTDRDLYNSIVTYQQQEKKGNTEEIEKFYRLVGDL